MRVGIDVRALVGERTGLGWYTHAVTSRILHQRPDHELVLLSDRAFPEAGGWSSLCRVRIRGGLWHPTPVRALWDDWYYGRMLEETGCQVALSPLSVVTAGQRVPCVAVVHDLAFLKYPEILPYSYRRYWTRTLLRAARRADAIVAVSNATREDLVFYCRADAGRIEVIGEGVDRYFFEPVPTDEAERVLNAFNLLPGYLLFVGTDEPRKNLSVVFEAYAMLDEELRRAHPLVIAGGRGWLSRQGQARERALSPFVYRLGHVERRDLRVLYRHASCFLFPSLYEGFGLPVLEAMACGAPVITSGISSLPEVAGAAAEYVDPRSPRSLARAVERVLSDTQRRAVMIANGRKQAAGFDWDVTARKTWWVLERVAGRAGG